MIIKYLSPAGLSKLISKMKAAFSEKNHSHQLSDLSGTVPVSKGGTGATEAAQARTNLGVTPANIGAAPASHTHDAGNIASGLIPIVRGGTGGATPAAARQNLGITPQNIGALPASGGTMTESICFEGNTVGLVWETANGTVFSLRPYAAGNVFQITTQGPDTENAEQPSFNITSGGHLELNHALGVTSGGTGAKNALGAAINLGLSDPDEMDFVATDATDWENQVKAHILDRIQDRRCMMFTAGWSGRGFGSGLAWKADGNVYVLIFNQEATKTLKLWFYQMYDQNWAEFGIG